MGLLEKLDPPRIPRIGAGTDPEDAPVSDNRFLHGEDGLANLDSHRSKRQHVMSSEKPLLTELSPTQTMLPWSV